MMVLSVLGLLEAARQRKRAAAVNPCQHLPEMCGGTIPGWKYDGFCECGDFLLWEGTESYPRTFGVGGHDTPNRCTP